MPWPHATHVVPLHSEPSQQGAPPAEHVAPWLTHVTQLPGPVGSLHA